jgi:hypothetical protein
MGQSNDALPEVRCNQMESKYFAVENAKYRRKEARGDCNSTHTADGFTILKCGIEHVTYRCIDDAITEVSNHEPEECRKRQK